MATHEVSADERRCTCGESFARRTETVAHVMTAWDAEDAAEAIAS